MLLQRRSWSRRIPCGEYLEQCSTPEACWPLNEANRGCLGADDDQVCTSNVSYGSEELDGRLERLRMIDSRRRTLGRIGYAS